MHQDVESIMFTKEQLAARIGELAAQLDKEYAGKTPLMVGILKGSVMFYADLLRAMTIPVEMDFIAISSYGSGAKSSGEVKLIKDLDRKIEGKDVIIVEDIIDSGRTLAYLMEVLRQRGPKSIELCTLLDKPERRVKKQVQVKYTCFTIPDEFVVGYGLDYDQKYRNLPFIGVVEQ